MPAAPGMRPAEWPFLVWAFLLAWPWFLAGVVAWTATGEAVEGRGRAAAAVIAAGVVFLALVGAPILSVTLKGLEPWERAGRACVMAALSGALALPALFASTLAAPAGPGTVVSGAVVLALAAYALAQGAALLGRFYPLAAVLWLGAPPLVYYLLWDVLGRRVDWLLVLGPASGAAWMVYGVPSVWMRLPGPALVLALAGAAASLVRQAGRAPSRQ